jgi:hypothetical protein
MRNMRKLMAAAAIGSVVVLSACLPNLGNILGGGGGSSPPASVTGKWSTIATSSQNSNDVVDIEVNISQSTGTISAVQNVILSNSKCENGTDSLDGTVKGSTVAFTLSFGTGNPTATFTGTVSSNGLSMSGKYKITSGSCSPADSGTWTATKFGDSSGSYMGTFASAVITKSFGVTAVVQEDASDNLQVTATLTGANCVALLLTGKAIGSALQTENADQTITVLAQASAATFATLAVQYKIGGTSCGVADTGTGSLSKIAAAAVTHPGASSQINPITQSLFAKMQEILDSAK